MIHHPILIGAKLVVLAVIVIVLIILHGVLPPEHFMTALKVGIGVFVLSIMVIWGGFFIMLSNPNSKLSKSVVLTAASQEDSEQKVKEQQKLEALIGTVGVAETNLRPCGIGRFNGRLIDVISDRSFIDKNEQITVSSVDGKKVIVEKV